MLKTSRLLLLMVVPVVLFATCLFMISAANALISTERASSTHAVVALVHQPTGMVDLRWNPGTEQLTVSLSLTGLTPSSIHPASIRQGNCQAAGAILFALKPVVVNALGVGSSQMVLDHVTNGIPVAGWSVDVLNGPQLTSADHVLPVACTTISNTRHRTSVLFDFNPTTAFDQSK